MTTATPATRSNRERAAPRTQDSGAGAAPSSSSPLSVITGQLAHELLPQLSGRLVDAAAGRARHAVDGLTGRLETVAADGGTAGAGGLKAVLTGQSPTDSAETSSEDEPDSGATSSLLGKLGGGLSALLQHAIAVLEVIKQWARRALAAAAQMLHRDTPTDEDDEGGQDGEIAHDDSADEDAANDAGQDAAAQDEADAPATPGSGSTVSRLRRRAGRSG